MKKHERELSELNAAHSRETQNMLSDFNKAQEVLKDKISALQILYVLLLIPELSHAFRPHNQNRCAAPAVVQCEHCLFEKTC